MTSICTSERLQPSSGLSAAFSFAHAKVVVFRVPARLLLLTSFSKRPEWSMMHLAPGSAVLTSGCRTALYFRSALGFCTQTLAIAQVSLVRVTRRACRTHFVNIVTEHGNLPSRTAAFEEAQCTHSTPSKLRATRGPAKRRSVPAFAASIARTVFEGGCTVTEQAQGLPHSSFPQPFSCVQQWMLTRTHTEVKALAQPHEHRATAREGLLTRHPPVFAHSQESACGKKITGSNTFLFNGFGYFSLSFQSAV